MLSQNIIYDEDFNSLSIEAQWLFVRMLMITDDCGVIPASEYSLKSMCNLPNKIYSKLQDFLYELINAKLIQGFVYENKKYFCFKKDTFDDYQAFIIKNRTRSEYLKMDKDSYLEFYNSLQEITINYSNFFDNESYHIYSKEYKVKSKELKEKSKEQKEIPPKIENVIKHFEEKGSSKDNANRFFNYYESNGWKVGKNKMVNWHSAVANWLKNNYYKPEKQTQTDYSNVGHKI